MPENPLETREWRRPGVQVYTKHAAPMIMDGKECPQMSIHVGIDLEFRGQQLGVHHLKKALEELQKMNDVVTDPEQKLHRVFNDMDVQKDMHHAKNTFLEAGFHDIGGGLFVYDFRL